MSEFQTAQQPSQSPAALPPTNRSEASAFSLDGFLALDVAPVPGVPPQVLALAGKTISDDGGFSYAVIADGTFKVTKLPTGTSPEVLGRALRPDNEFAAAWKKLCDKVVADSRVAPAPAPAPSPSAGAPPAPVVPAPTTGGNVILDGISAIGEQLIAPIAGGIGDIVDGGMTWLDELLFGAPAAAPAAPAAPAPAPATPMPGAGSEDNLAKAIALKEQLKQGYKKVTADDGTKCKTDLIGGKAENLTTVNCGQFTAATLAESGYDLNTEYIDPTSGLPLAYTDGTANDGTTKVTFVTAFMLVNCQPEAVGSMLAAQGGNVLRIEGDAVADYCLSKYNTKFETAEGTTPPATVAPADRSAFAVSSQLAIKGMAATDGLDFGAGAVAQMFGGTPIDDLTKRMPGDIQQRLDVAGGTFTGDGHSSTVYAVKGTGTCYYDPANAGSCATPASVPAVAGWYTGTWTIGPTTQPIHVSRFSASEVQLIDANGASDKNAAGKQREQAVDIGAFKGVTKQPESESTGRLPTSKWLGWQDDHVPAPDAKPL